MYVWWLNNILQLSIGTPSRTPLLDNAYTPFLFRLEHHVRLNFSALVRDGHAAIPKSTPRRLPYYLTFP